MLGKLLKHEFRATARIFGLMYAGLLALAGMNAAVLFFTGLAPINYAGVFQSVFFDVMGSLLVLSYMLMLLAVIILNFVIIVVRFYRLYGDEGYLWHTLPVSVDQHLICKLIVATVWSLASAAVVIISIGLIFIADWPFSDMGTIAEATQELRAFGIPNGFLLFTVSTYVFTALLARILSYFAPIAIGPNLTKSRLGGSVLAYVLISICRSVIEGFVTTVVMVVVASMATAGGYTNSINVIPDVLGNVNSSMLFYFGAYTVYFVALSIAFYLVTRHFTSHRLNLP